VNGFYANKSSLTIVHTKTGKRSTTQQYACKYTNTFTPL